jgi:outer membrane protein OmpA-like peptidoglycan-associated protein
LRKFTRVALLLASLVAGATATIALEHDAHAQDAGSFYLDRAQIAGGPDDSFMTFRPVFSERPRFYGSFTLGYALNPLRIATLSDRQNVVDQHDNPFINQLITYFGAGLQLNRRLGFDVMVPVAWLNGGGADPAPDVGNGLAQGIALHDIRLSLRALAVESDDKTFRWGAGGAVFVPSGNDARFTSDSETTVWLFTNLEHHFKDLMVVWMIGPHFRPTQGPKPSTLQVGNEIRYSIGAFMPLRDARLRIGAELWGQFGFSSVTNTEATPNTTENAFFRSQNTGLEWLAQARWSMDKKDTWYIQAGGGTRLGPGYGFADVRVLGQIGTHIYLHDIGPDEKQKAKAPIDNVPLEADKDTDGDGFPDEIDQCPLVKEDGKPPFTDDGCPDLDRDDDGILDKDDKCPDTPEDKDGIEDEDGCPEDDADKDGILDKEDACPTVAGVKNTDPAKNGCPAEKKKIIVGVNEIKLLEPIKFEYNKATILKDSFELLDEVVSLMNERSSLRLGIYGHTDNQGGADYNKKLSERRAAAVVQYIVKKGIAESRLESAGYGMERPVEDNGTEEGRAKNRRVEFKILVQ